MNIQEAFASNVRKYRKASHLSQEKLAELAGLHRTYIGGIEQRRVNVSLKNIGKIADALGVDPAVLFLNDQDEKPRTANSQMATPRRFTRDSEHSTDSAVKSSASEHALVSWNDGSVTIRPIEVPYEDLTIRVLCSPIPRWAHAPNSAPGMRFEGSRKSRLCISAGHRVVTFNMLVPKADFAAWARSGIGDLHAKPRISCRADRRMRASLNARRAQRFGENATSNLEPCHVRVHSDLQRKPQYAKQPHRCHIQGAPLLDSKAQLEIIEKNRKDRKDRKGRKRIHESAE